MWQLVLTLTSEGVRGRNLSVAQGMYVLETELERAVSWVILGLENYNSLLPGLQPDASTYTPKLGRKER